MGRHRTLKQCPTCGTGDTAKFGSNKARRDGLQTYCRECNKMLRSWSKETRLKTVSQKRNFDAALVEQYVTRLISQE